MFKAATATLAAALFAGALADQPSPLRWRGQFTGTRQQKFALADPNVTNSFECLPQSNMVTIQDLNVTISENDFTQNGSEAFNVTVGGATYLVPAQPAFTMGWADLTDAGILTLRSDNETVECHHARMTGAGDRRQITIVTLGGGNITYVEQCDPAVYARIPDVWNTPWCATPGDGTLIPMNSTVITKINYQGGGLPDTGSGAAQTLLSALAAVGAGAAVLML